jgi:hypothetical protein
LALENHKEPLTGFFFCLYSSKLATITTKKPLKMNKLLIASAALLLLAGCQKREKKDAVSVGDAVQDTIPAPENHEVFGPQCYLQVITGKGNNGKSLNDSTIFNIEKRDGDSIWGIFHWKPAEKDKKIATFKGEIKGAKGRAIANSHAEGMNYNEEVLFTLKDSTLTVKYSEMTEGKDGIWYYKDKAKLSEQVLSKVGCK